MSDTATKEKRTVVRFDGCLSILGFPLAVFALGIVFGWDAFVDGVVRILEALPW